MDPTEWIKTKTRLQEELGQVLVQLEHLKLEQLATAIRRVAVEPENNFGTATEWIFGILDVVDEVSASADLPQDLRSRLLDARSQAWEVDAEYRK